MIIVYVVFPLFINASITIIVLFLILKNERFKKHNKTTTTKYWGGTGSEVCTPLPPSQVWPACVVLQFSLLHNHARPLHVRGRSRLRIDDLYSTDHGLTLFLCLFCILLQGLICSQVKFLYSSSSSKIYNENMWKLYGIMTRACIILCVKITSIIFTVYIDIRCVMHLILSKVYPSSQITEYCQIYTNFTALNKRFTRKYI